jgi:hypothetical protein
MFRLLAWSVFLAVIGFGSFAALSAQSQHEASTGCDARAVEVRLTGTDKSRHKNLCMAAAGYKRTLVCEKFGLASTDAEVCFAPWWKFWTSEAMLAT